VDGGRADVLDRFLDAVDPQPAFVDTAEMYGNGASEQILGDWMAARRARDRVVVADRGLPGQEGTPAGGGGDPRRGRAVAAAAAEGAAAHVGERGDRVLTALGDVAREHGVPVPAVALRWLADRPTVVAPMASGRTVEQPADLLPMRDLVLTDGQREQLDEASAG
jgi:aryl-alcohol dehydrogenase-like predicted oxidoreductase